MPHPHPRNVLRRPTLNFRYYVTVKRAALLVALAVSCLGQTTPAVRVPFISCKSDGQAGPVPPPKPVEKRINLDPGVASRLAYYESGLGSGVLAPRGWSCFGLYGSSGSLFIVAPRPVDSLSSPLWPLSGPAIILNSTWGGTSGRFEVAKVVARVFPHFKPFVQRVIELFDFFAAEVVYGPYQTDTLTYRSDRIVEFQTPPMTAGLGTIDGHLDAGADPIAGVAIAEGETPDLTLLTVRLPSAMQALTPHIISYVEQ
jgi:hypothetical protein